MAEQPTSWKPSGRPLARADFDQLTFLAHSLKGAAATMCAPCLRQASHDLEQAARDRDAPRAGVAFAALEEKLREVVLAMRERLDAPPG